MICVCTSCTLFSGITLLARLCYTCTYTRVQRKRLLSLHLRNKLCASTLLMWVYDMHACALFLCPYTMYTVRYACVQTCKRGVSYYTCWYLNRLVADHIHANQQRIIGHEKSRRLHAFQHLASLRDCLHALLIGNRKSNSSWNVDTYIHAVADNRLKCLVICCRNDSFTL